MLTNLTNASSLTFMAFSVSFAFSFFEMCILQGVTIDLAAQEDQQLVGQWGRDLQNPHDVTIARLA